MTVYGSKMNIKYTYDLYIRKKVNNNNKKVITFSFYRVIKKLFIVDEKTKLKCNIINIFNDNK